jgi:hypothetical protein
MTQPNFAELANGAAAAKDFTDVKTGSNFEKELPAEGICVLRLREYIEMGLCTASTKTYPTKKPVQKARFVFEVLTPRHIKEITNEATKEVTKIVPTLSITCPISDNDKSNYIKLFKQLNWEGKVQHPAQCLGKGYLATIVHAGEAKGEITKDNPAKYANLQKDGAFTIAPPRKVDALAGTDEPINVPELNGGMKLFLWDNPTIECWDSLFIDGTYTKKVNDVETEVSKNWIQGMLKDALDFDTSKLYEMLQGGGLDDLPTSKEEAAKEKETATVTTDAAADPLAGIC